jgi:hypothetical protein
MDRRLGTSGPRAGGAPAHSVGSNPPVAHESGRHRQRADDDRTVAAHRVLELSRPVGHSEAGAATPSASVPKSDGLPAPAGEEPWSGRLRSDPVPVIWHRPVRCLQGAWNRMVAEIAAVAAVAGRRLGTGEGVATHGRVLLSLGPGALSHLAQGRRVVATAA